MSSPLAKPLEINRKTPSPSYLTMKNLENYNSIMYSDPLPKFLRTGDIVKLELCDFKEIVRDNAILKLFKSYENNPQYNQKLWAVLNKPCDMVHYEDEKTIRYFKNNLFLSPLQKLKDALRKGTLGSILHIEDTPNAKEFLLKTYKKFISKMNGKRNCSPPWR